MKWFKHMTASWDDERLARLVGSGGQEGLAMYGLYWRLLEIVAAQMEGKTPSCSVQYPLTRWSLLLSLRGSHVFSTLARLAVTGVVTVERLDADVRVTIPNLLKYRDEYARKSGHPPENIPPRTEEEEEGEQKKKQKEQKPLLDDEHRAKVSQQENEIYKAYPRQVAPDAALKAIRKAVIRLVEGTAHQAPMDEVDARRFLWKKAAEYSASPAGQKSVGDKDYRPHPSTWFNQGHYFTDIREWQKPNGYLGGVSNGKIERAYNAATKLIEEVEDHHGSHAGELLPWSGAE